jgi:NAD(P)-dependent dehydrogenase (short-subunit alcohol dehydrogenase family)
MSLSINLSGKRAFVTGVTSGIGAGIAQHLAKAGCHVAGCGRSAPESEGARAFVNLVEAEGVRAAYLQTDIACRAAAGPVITSVVEAIGGLDLLVSNAGRNIFKGAEKATDADWDECMELDLAAHWRVAQAALPHLRKAAPGVVLIIGSNHAWGTIPGCFPYNVAKSALLGLVCSLAIEWGPDVRTVGIAPGFIDTAGNQSWFDSFPDAAAERARTEALHPVGRIGTVDEIGALCAFLASPLAGFISGTTLCVDGGRSAYMQDG